MGVALTVIGFLLSVAGMLLRGLAAHRGAVGNMFEFTVTAMIFIVGAYLIMVWRAGVRWLGLPVTLLAAVGNGLAVTVFLRRGGAAGACAALSLVLDPHRGGGHLRSRVQRRRCDVDSRT